MPATKQLPAAFASELPDDLGWLAEDHGTPYTLQSCHFILRPLPVGIEKHDREIAEKRHEYGTVLIDLLKHGAVATLGCATLAEFFEKHCGLDAAEAFDNIRFAKGVTAEQATVYRYSRCRLGITLVQRLGRKDLADLARTPIDVPVGEGRTEPLAFTPRTPVSRLRWALAQLRRAPPRTEPEKPSQTVARRYRAMERIVEEHLESFPVLAEAGLEVTLYAGEPRVKHRPLTTPAQFEAAEELYGRLKKVR